MKRYINLILLFLVVRIFALGSFTTLPDKTNKEIADWLRGKTLVSITQSSERNMTYITIVAEQL